jgi:dTDP-4-dehydrorhamnose reductase
MNPLTSSSPILVVGASGLLGSFVVKHLKNSPLLTPSHAQLDITQRQQVFAFMAAHQPRLIINCAAYTDVRASEHTTHLAMAVNAVAVQTLAEVSAQHKARLIHISTDYVFAGQKTTPYTENDTPNPQTVYGMSKWQGEQAMTHSLKPELGVILRTSWLCSPQQGLLVALFSQLKNAPELCLEDRITSSPTWVHSLAQVIAILAIQPHLHGVFHVSARGAVTPYQLAQELQTQALEKGLLVTQKILRTGYKDTLVRPAYSSLCGQKLEKKLGWQQEPWQQVVTKFLASQQPHL